MKDSYSYELHHGDALNILRGMPDNSIDSVVTDPPYGLSFMGKRWDYDVPSVELWVECLRVLKPGGHLLAFAGTRTQHRMAVRIEDAGFEIRDMIAWVYGSGFPKSLDVSKAIDRQRFDLADIYRLTEWIRAARDAAKIGNWEIDKAFGFNGMAGHWTSAKSQPLVPTLEQVPLLLDVLGLTPDDVPEDIRKLLCDLNGRKHQPSENWWKRKVVKTEIKRISNESVWGQHSASGMYAPGEHQVNITTPATDAAKQWDGWGTALKPALEPITLARKPLAERTVAANVLTWGTGGVNVDGCRVGADEMPRTKSTGVLASENRAMSGANYVRETTGTVTGRFPANLIHDGSDEVVRLFPVTGPSKAVKGARAGKSAGRLGAFSGQAAVTMGHDDQGGSAARFFYCAKASRSEREAGCEGLEMKYNVGTMSGDADGSLLTGSGNPRDTSARNHHPTVKPIALMRYLCRLVTPPGGIVLDPFTGSGTTGCAAMLEGFGFIGMERETEYIEIARRRIEYGISHNQVQHPTLFDERER